MKGLYKEIKSLCLHGLQLNCKSATEQNIKKQARKQKADIFCKQNKQMNKQTKL